jgi:dethiobiotin synthetase
MVNHNPASGVFITATDTNAGKTQIAAAILLKLAELGTTAVGMKPVASGARMTPLGLRSDDAEILIRASGVTASYEAVNPYVFAPPIAPHLAAMQVSESIDLQRILVKYESLLGVGRFFVVEGVGGWKVPLSKKYNLSHLAALLNLPIILVVAIRLGCINHALLSAESITRDGSNLIAWVANHLSPQDGDSDTVVAALNSRLAVPLLAEIPFIENCCPEKIASAFDSRQIGNLLPDPSRI